MSYKKERLPSAAREFKWFCETYGFDACETAKAWTVALVESASSDKQLAAIKLEGVIEQLLSTDIEEESGAWKRFVDKFKDASLRQQLLALAHIVRTRKPPWRSYVAMREITCLGHVQVELYAYYEVNHVDKRVVFIKFDSCGTGNNERPDA